METAPNMAQKSQEEISRVYQKHNISWPEVFAADVQALKEKGSRFLETGCTLSESETILADYKAKVKEVLAANEAMKQAVYKYFGGADEIGDFKVRLWESEARHLEQIKGALDANATSQLPAGGVPRPEVMAEAKKTLISRTMNILDMLGRKIANAKDADADMEKISKEYLIAPLNSEPLMQKLNYQTLEMKTPEAVFETARQIEQEVRA